MISRSTFIFCSRPFIHSSGVPNRVQISRETAFLLKEAGKGEWCTPRSEQVKIKGKGVVNTFFIVTQTSKSVTSSQHSGESHSNHDQLFGSNRKMDKKSQRLVEWNVMTLSGHLKAVVARRLATRKVQGSKRSGSSATLRFKSHQKDGITRVDEMDDVISMPVFDVRVAEVETDPDSIDLGPVVMSQLHSYIGKIATMYRDNPFHNFRHASHVAMSVDKLLKRIVTPDIHLEVDDEDAKEAQRKAVMMGLHDYTHGITSDPLTQFGVVLSALIHDVVSCVSVAQGSVCR